MAHNPRHIDNGSIHGMSLLVGQLKGAVESMERTVEHLNSNWKMKDEAAGRSREALADKVDELRQDVGDMKVDVVETKHVIESVQQDVAEMKNDMEAAQNTLADYEKNKPVMVAVLTDVGKLKDFVSAFEKKEAHALGAVEVIKKIGKVGWAGICAVLTALLAIVVYWVQHQM